MKCSRAARRAQPARAAKALAAATVANSVCAYCAVGCGQNVYVQDGGGTQIDGDPDWQEVAELCEEAYRVIAPARLAAVLDAQT